jgi:hypothetical protein
VTPSYPLAAALVGLVGFAAVEFATQTLGVPAGLTTSLWADALIYALTSVTLALTFRPALRRARRWKLFLLPVGHLLLFAPLAGLFGALVGLSLEGNWGEAALVTSALWLVPLNLVVTLTVEVGGLALPLGIASVALIGYLARR